jgi:hypothetical protein
MVRFELRTQFGLCSFSFENGGASESFGFQKHRLLVRWSRFPTGRGEVCQLELGENLANLMKEEFGETNRKR